MPRNARRPVLIPAFAVGRTQEIVYLIRELEDEKAIPVLPVIVDSPMAAAATTAYANRKEEHDEDYASVLAQTTTSIAHTFDDHRVIASRNRKGLNDAQGCARDH